MISTIQLIIIIFALFALSRAILRYKDKAISKKELAAWITIWSLLIIATAFTNTLKIINKIGIKQQPLNTITYISIILLFYLLFKLYVRIDKMKKEITKIVRIEAMKNGKK